MRHWVELGLLVLMTGGVVQGYLGGVRRTGAVALALLLVCLAARAFGEAGARYLTLYHHMDVKIVPVLLERLPLVITVAPISGTLTDPGSRAIMVVENMPLAPVYQSWLAGLPPFAQSHGGVGGHHVVAQVFSNLLLKRGVFLLFFLIMLAGSRIIDAIIKEKNGGSRGLADKLAGALLGGGTRLLVLAVVLTALAPFFPLFFSFLAWDVAESPLVQFLIGMGLFILPSL